MRKSQHVKITCTVFEGLWTQERPSLWAAPHGRGFPLLFASCAHAGPAAYVCRVANGGIEPHNPLGRNWPVFAYPFNTGGCTPVSIALLNFPAAHDLPQFRHTMRCLFRPAKPDSSVRIKNIPNVIIVRNMARPHANPFLYSHNVGSAPLCFLFAPSSYLQVLFLLLQGYGKFHIQRLGILCNVLQG